MYVMSSGVLSEVMYRLIDLGDIIVYTKCGREFFGLFPRLSPLHGMFASQLPFQEAFKNTCMMRISSLGKSCSFRVDII
jgi:hypothetical protein